MQHDFVGGASTEFIGCHQECALWPFWLLINVKAVNTLCQFIALFSTFEHHISRRVTVLFTRNMLTG